MTAQSDQVVSFFSGAGGFSYGFSLAGMKPVSGAEIDKDACSTYETNIGSTCHNVDLSVVSPSFFVDIVTGHQPFAVIGGPPCQGFSTAGSRNTEDPRNKLIFNYLRIVAELKPRWFIFENVEGLLTAGHGEAMSSLVHEFIKLGYSVRLEKVNFAAYGVPQTRKRVLIIGNSLGLEFEFPEETFSFESGKSKKRNGKPFSPSLDEALSGLGPATLSRTELVHYTSGQPVNDYDQTMRKGCLAGAVSQHYHSTEGKDLYRYALLKPGQTMKDLPEEYWHESFRRRAFRRVMDGTPTARRGGAPSGITRLHGNLNSLTITSAASREFIHPYENRPLTLRECARIQSFPDAYEFHGNGASVAQQIGNAVPPLAAAAFAKHLQILDGQLGSGTCTLKTHNQPKLLGFMLTDAMGMSPALQKTQTLLNDMRQEDLFA